MTTARMRPVPIEIHPLMRGRAVQSVGLAPLASTFFQADPAAWPGRTAARRCYMRPAALIALFLFTATGCSSSDSVGTADEAVAEQAPTPIGLWVVPESQTQKADAQAKAAGEHVVYLAPSPFYFHGDSATMHLISMKAWTWRTEDGYFRVKTKWVDDDLYWLPPFGGWSKIATFRNGRFEVDGDDVLWKYERVSPKELPERLRPLLKKREIHDYAITPHGDRDPSRLKDLE
ncbi:unnamed protein product [uncultured bacterium]|nr:unnamed protein product [uncultured bacterium]